MVSALVEYRNSLFLNLTMSPRLNLVSLGMGCFITCSTYVQEVGKPKQIWWSVCLAFPEVEGGVAGLVVGWSVVLDYPSYGSVGVFDVEPVVVEELVLVDLATFDYCFDYFFLGEVG